MKTKISASVVLYNTPESQLKQLLCSITQSTLPVNTYLIDNSPKALSYSCMQQPSLTYIRSRA